MAGQYRNEIYVPTRIWGSYPINEQLGFKGSE